MHRRRQGLLLVACLSAAPVTGWAQAEATRSGDLQEVIVTAQRRAERLQDVPISISAISGATLENFGERSFNDYATTIPNLAVTSGAGAGGNGNAFGVSSTRAIAIRGVFGNNTTGFYLNDTPIPMSLDPRVVDIDRVEVLRGPQGTLFGQGSMGGTVRLVTREPQLTKFEAKVDALGSYTQHGGGGYSAEGMVNVPLVNEQLAFRANVYSAWNPGLYTRTWGPPLDPRNAATAAGIGFQPGITPAVGSKAHVGAQQSTGTSMSLKYAPEFVPGLTITPLFMYQRTSTNGYPLADYTPDNFTQSRPLNVSESVEDTWTFGSLTAKQQLPFGRLIVSGTYFYRTAYDLEDTTDSNALVFWRIPYFVPAPLPNKLITRTWNGEARFETTFNFPVNFVLGFFDSLNERRFQEKYLTPGLDAATGGALGTDLQYVQDTPNADRERAVFLDATWKVTDQLQVSAGIRSAHLNHEGAYTASGPLNGGVSGPPDTYANHSERDNAPRFTAKYQYLPNQMAYLSAAKGFRIGGTNSKLPPICDADLAALGLKNGAPFTTDSLWSYEVGSKNELLENRVRTRAAAYWIEWKGIQQSVYLPCTFNVYANSGAARSRGAEFELDAAVMQGLTVNVALGYEDAQITQATTASRTVLGQPLTGVPKWSGSASAQYSVPLGSERQGFVRAQWEHVGQRLSFNNVAPVDGGRNLSSYSLLNLRVGLNQGRYEATLFVDNVTNKLGIIGDLIPEGAELPGRPRFFVTRPRTVGLELRRDF